MTLKLPYKSGEQVRVTSTFGKRVDPISGDVGVFHGGIDLVGQGSKVLLAPADGVIGTSAIVDRATDTGRTWEWGHFIRLDTDDGLQIFMCHMATRYVVAGQRVKKGDEIGLEGSTGYSTGSHCHFEVRRDGVQIDPTLLLGIKNESGTIWTVDPLKAEDEILERNTPHDWAEDAVDWAKKTGILLGDTDGNLKLHDNATREEMLVFLKRTYDLIKKGG